MSCELFVNLLLAHVAGDFYCQTDKSCEEKRQKKLKSRNLYVHSMAIGVLSWLLVWDWSFLIWSLVITVSHFAIDAIKIFAKDGLVSFIADQVMHIAVLVAVCCLWSDASNWMLPERCYWSGHSIPLIVTSVLVLGKPANIMIKKTLAQYKISESGAESNKVGSLIGTLERLMAFLFIMIGEMNAVGFLLAAKSILRFRDSDTVKTEYVLAGTLLSFGIAVVVGMIAVSF